MQRTLSPYPLTELTMYRAGELDITFAVPGSHVQQLRERHADQLIISPFLTVYYLAFDLSEAPFDNAALRQALSMAIDREPLGPRHSGPPQFHRLHGKCCRRHTLTTHPYKRPNQPVRCMH